MHKKIFALITSLILVSVLVVGCNTGGSGVKKFLGNWEDISNSERFAKIYEDGKGAYTWEDNEDKYPAKFENGVLKVNAGKVDEKEAIATVTYDEATKHLKVTLLEDKFEFKKK